MFDHPRQSEYPALDAVRLLDSCPVFEVCEAETYVEELVIAVVSLPEPARSVLISRLRLARENESETELIARLELDAAYLDQLFDLGLQFVHYAVTCINATFRGLGPPGS